MDSGCRYVTRLDMRNGQIEALMAFLAEPIGLRGSDRAAP